MTKGERVAWARVHAPDMQRIQVAGSPQFCARVLDIVSRPEPGGTKGLQDSNIPARSLVMQLPNARDIELGVALPNPASLRPMALVRILGELAGPWTYPTHGLVLSPTCLQYMAGLGITGADLHNPHVCLWAGLVEAGRALGQPHMGHMHACLQEPQRVQEMTASHQLPENLRELLKAYLDWLYKMDSSMYAGKTIEYRFRMLNRGMAERMKSVGWGGYHDFDRTGVRLIEAVLPATECHANKPQNRAFVSAAVERFIVHGTNPHDLVATHMSAIPGYLWPLWTDGLVKMVLCTGRPQELLWSSADLLITHEPSTPLSRLRECYRARLGWDGGALDVHLGHATSMLSPPRSPGHPRCPRPGQAWPGLT